MKENIKDDKSLAVRWREALTDISTESEDLSESTELESIGQLKHTIQLLSIKMLEKDMEIKNLRTSSTSNHQLNGDRVDSLSNITIEKKNNTNKLDEHSKKRLIGDQAPPATAINNPIESEYVQIKEKHEECPSTEDLLNLQLQENSSKQPEVSHEYRNCSIKCASIDSALQLERGIERKDNLESDAFSISRQLQLVKKDNEYLRKQMELLKEKLLVTEKRHQEVTKQLNEIETERLAANARAVSAEQIQQNLRDQINEDRRARESVLPFLLGNQLSKENSSRTHEIHGLQCELSSIRSERDALRVRFESSVLEVNRLRKDCENYRKTLELHLREQPYSSGPRETQDILTKTRLAALEVQLSAACAARNDALRHVGHLNAKLETTSKAFYELESKRKVQVSHLEAKLEVSSHKLAIYEKLESELDRAIETHSDICYEDMLPADVLESPAGLREHLNNCGPVGTLLPTLASRRLEHCLQLSRRLAECEKMKISLQKCNERLEKDLEASKVEAIRTSSLLSAIDKPTKYLATALISRDSKITTLQQEKRGLEQKLRKLYDCTKNLVAERKAMIADVQEFMPTDNISGDTTDIDATQEVENSPPIKLHLPRKTRGLLQ